MYRRMLAFLFEYRNGIRGQSKGILRLFGEESAPEVMLEFSESGLCHKKWTFFCFDGKNRIIVQTARFRFSQFGDLRRIQRLLGLRPLRLAYETGHRKLVVARNGRNA